MILPLCGPDVNGRSAAADYEGVFVRVKLRVEPLYTPLAGLEEMLPAHSTGRTNDGCDLIVCATIDVVQQNDLSLNGRQLGEGGVHASSQIGELRIALRARCSRQCPPG